MWAGRDELAEPRAGKSTLNRMELGRGAKDRYKKITYWKDSIDELLVKLFLESHRAAPEQIILDVDTADLPLHGKQEGRGSSTATTTGIAICRGTSFAESMGCVRACGKPTMRPRLAAGRKSQESWCRCERRGRK